MVPSSNATKLAANKTKLAQALRDVQGKTAMGSLQQLMMQHFRDTTSHLWFYSLSLEVAKSLPMKEMSAALTSMLSIKGQPAQPAGTLPLEDEFQRLPLEERAQRQLQPLQGPQASFLEAVEDDSMGPTPQAHEHTSGGDCGFDLQQLVDHCELDGLLVFKIADKNPHLKKRVMGSVDNVTFADMAIRIYKAHSHTEDELCISPMSNVEVPLVQFFAGKDPQKIMDHMLCWRLENACGTDADFDASISLQLKLKPVGRVFQQRLACPLTLQAIDVKRNIKPTPFELYLELSVKGWSWKTWRGKRADLKKLSVNLDPRANGKETLVLGGNDSHDDIAEPMFPEVEHREGDAASGAMVAVGDVFTPEVPTVPSVPVPPRAPPVGPRAPKKKPLTNKEKAANGSHKIGPWTRQRILCPHQPNGSIDVWAPEFGGSGAHFTKSLCETMDNFEKGRHDADSFYMFLVVGFYLFGW
eukprot:symbB.v1.2.001727.t1/scaffold61.1/size362833/26